jgi:hypothetical protein
MNPVEEQPRVATGCEQSRRDVKDALCAPAVGVTVRPDAELLRHATADLEEQLLETGVGKAPSVREARDSRRAGRACERALDVTGTKCPFCPVTHPLVHRRCAREKSPLRRYV